MIARVQTADGVVAVDLEDELVLGVDAYDVVEPEPPVSVDLPRVLATASSGSTTATAATPTRCFTRSPCAVVRRRVVHVLRGRFRPEIVHASRAARNRSLAWCLLKAPCVLVPLNEVVSRDLCC